MLGREPLDHHRLIALEYRQLYMLAQGLVQHAHERHGHLAQWQCPWSQGPDFPEPDPYDKRSTFRAFQEPGIDQFPRDPARRRVCKSGPARYLGESQLRPSGCEAAKNVRCLGNDAPRIFRAAPQGSPLQQNPMFIE
ncbi:hypothetical protein NCCP1664_18050 [Zafaria cholistanensis]|uniref:Uncharacterized protein n=1 Tax=Zafaria cholistanensis TaxID=1682741 RepID=A0A5A7NRG5_9MICC|nr:hypothetical protein NCCP1664_18050 [Zafaria cholistanensis]